MPKLVDHSARREQIADALLNVVARDGLAAVSLRNVAAEAGVTAGMVQHYFASKDEMMSFAMQEAGARYEQRIRSSVASLGPGAAPGDTLRAVLANFVPRSEGELHDGRISLEFQAYAATRPDLSRHLQEGEEQLRAWLGQLLAAAAGLGTEAATVRATGLLATAEGLGVQVIGSGLASQQALTALDEQLRRNGVAVSTVQARPAQSMPT